jgi:phosphopentomutase
VEGYAAALKEFDGRIPEIISKLAEDDILFITADHGCDPTTESTDHSREYVPLFIYGRNVKKGINLGIRSSFSDLGATVAEYLETEKPVNGKSFLKQIIK